MPHSSGGGSRGGGSHHSSHHSSSGSSSGSSSRISRKPFAGAHKYVYYSKGNINYIYSNKNISGTPLSKLRYFILLFYIPFIFASFSILIHTYSSPSKIKIVGNTSVHVEDYAGVLDNESELIAKLEGFRDLTGIPVTILTVSNDTWMDYYDSLEKYAYEIYLKYFNDEKHWLIVYSEDSDPSHNQWYFEGMQGDDTDGVLSKEYTSKFNDRLTDSLYAKYDEGVTYCFIDAFNEIIPTIMHPRFHLELLIFGIVFSGFIIFHACCMLGLTPNSIRLRKATLVPDNSSLIECNYCGGSYYFGTVTTCPHCGAPIQQPSEII